MIDNCDLKFDHSVLFQRVIGLVLLHITGFYRI